jgi:hypothetical protein
MASAFPVSHNGKKRIVRADNFQTLLTAGCEKLAISKENVELQTKDGFIIDDDIGYDFVAVRGEEVFFVTR